MGYNNPVQELCAEAKNVFPMRPIDCIISIGTGSAPRGVLPRPKLWETKIHTNVISALKHISLNCETNHDRMLEQFEDKPGIYFRFNVYGSLENVGLEEWKKLGEIRSVTVDYMEGPDVRQRNAAAARALHRSLEGVGELLNLFDGKVQETWRWRNPPRRDQ